MDNNNLHEKDLEQVSGGGDSGFKYVFRTGEQIWADAAHTRYFVINEDVKTNDDDYEFSVTVIESSSSMHQPQTIHRSAYGMKWYIDTFGKKA